MTTHGRGGRAWPLCPAGPPLTRHLCSEVLCWDGQDLVRFLSWSEALCAEFDFPGPFPRTGVRTASQPQALPGQVSFTPPLSFTCVPPPPPSPPQATWTPYQHLLSGGCNWQFHNVFEETGIYTSIALAAMPTRFISFTPKKWPFSYFKCKNSSLL